MAAPDDAFFMDVLEPFIVIDEARRRSAAYKKLSETGLPFFAIIILTHCGAYYFMV